MQKPQYITTQEESDIKKIYELVIRNYKFFLISLITALILASLVNRYMIPVYKISSSILIKEESVSASRSNVNEYINSNIFGINQNFQNELWVLKSSPVIGQTIKNLDLSVNYYQQKGFQYADAYKNVPFKVLLLQNHIQPVNVRFNIAIKDNRYFEIRAQSKKAAFQQINKDEIAFQKDNWAFEQQGIFGKLIETPELAFVIQLDTSKRVFYRDVFVYSFLISDMPSYTEKLKDQLVFNIIQKDATVIQIEMKTPSVKKGKDIIDELMNVYSQQNLDRKNHIASITIDYIEKQLSEISDSLSKTENNLQSFRSSNQLLDVAEQAKDLSKQYMDLQNQMAELVTRKRYYDYVAEYLVNKEDFSDMIIPASMGIQDELLNELMSELVAAQAQRSNMIQNGQERNPMVSKLAIQIENTRKTITENISAVRKTTEISINEMNKRIRKTEAEINHLPVSQRQLGGIERKYRLNDAIYNYLMEKRAEAKITKASNLPDNIIIEPAKLIGTDPISPNKKFNYIIAIAIGLIIPFGFLTIKTLISDKLASQENIENLTDIPVLGKILHNAKKSHNVMFEYPKSSIAESYRALRTNLEYHFNGVPGKSIMITSSIEGEGKSFNALNIAMSYAQLDRKTILVDFDLRKPTAYFAPEEGSLVGLSSYYTSRVSLEEIIMRSPHEKLDYIPSGPLPPNPMELIARRKTKDLLEQLKSKYDCIILDTTPLAQVSDAYLLMNNVDIKVLIARYNYTLKKALSLIIKDFKKKNVDNVCIVMNDNRFYRDQFGYGYGYNKNRD